MKNLLKIIRVMQGSVILTVGLLTGCYAGIGAGVNDDTSPPPQAQPIVVGAPPQAQPPVEGSPQYQPPVVPPSVIKSSHSETTTTTEDTVEEQDDFESN